MRLGSRIRRSSSVRRRGTTRSNSGLFRSRARSTSTAQRTSYTRQASPVKKAATATKAAPAAPKKGVTRSIAPATQQTQDIAGVKEQKKAPANTRQAATPRARTAAPQDKAPVTKTPQEETPNKPASNLWEGKIGQGLSLLKEGMTQGLKDRYSVPPTEQERKAMEHIRSMLEPHKMGGADRTFNFGDQDAIVQSLMRDKNGLKNEVARQLRAEGKGWQVNAAMKGIDGGRGPFAQLARNKINKEAPGQIKQQLSQGLKEANINPATAGNVDNQARNLTFNEVNEFQRQAEILEGLQRRIAEKLGMEVTFPNGISQEAIDFTLQGKFGIPPGAKLTPLK